MKQKVIIQYSIIKTCLISGLFLFSACHSLTSRKAFIFLKKNAAFGVYHANSYGKEVYKDGALGYSYYIHNQPLEIVLKDGLYLLSATSDPVYQYNGYQSVGYCTNFAVDNLLVGNHKTGKCEGKWYTFTEYSVKVTAECRKKYKKYIEPEDKNKDTTHAKYYLLNKVKTYKNGFLDGNFICYDINGNIIYKTKFTQGTGYYKHFYPLDGIQEEGAYLNGFKQGKWTKYHGLPERDTFVRFYNKGVEIK